EARAYFIPMLRRGVSCALAGLLLVGAGEAYIFVGEGLWTRPSTAWVGIGLVFMAWIGGAWSGLAIFRRSMASSLYSCPLSPDRCNNHANHTPTQYPYPRSPVECPANPVGRL